MKFKKTIVLILLLSFLVCSAAFVQADAAELPFQTVNINEILQPDIDTLSSTTGSYNCVHFYTNFQNQTYFVKAPLVYNAIEFNLPGANGVFIADGRSLTTSGRSWKSTITMNFTNNVKNSMISGQEYIFDLYLAFYVDYVDTSEWNANDFQFISFVHDNLKFYPKEIFQYDSTLNIAHFNIVVSGNTIANNDDLELVFDRDGNKLNHSYFEFGIIPQFPCTVSVYSEEMKAADSILNAGSNVPQPDLNTPANDVASTNAALNDIEGQFKVDQNDIDNLNNTFDTLIAENDFSGGTQLLNNWYNRLFDAVPEVYLLLMFSLLLGLCAFVIGRGGNY